MAKFILVYLGGNPPATPEEGKAHMEKYMQWLSDLGDAAVSPANPLKGTCVVEPDGSVKENSQTGMSGYTIVEAESKEAALSIAKDCPFLATGGSLEVSEMITMPAMGDEDC